ncbi:hypothetical protein VTJ83DRAFT_3630 [Remersonia thermophila]|uniref:Transcription factor domain-containing protein n=1 Tax=Remersonia thermophila TaxID=72144 RepID=A0ABR4DGT9_9PEZI
MANSAKPAGKVRFVPHNVQGLPVKRKQVSHACVECRKKKKRCRHAPDAYSSDDDGSDLSSPPTSSHAGQQQPSRTPIETTTTSNSDRDTSHAAAQLLQFFHHASDKPLGTTPNVPHRPVPEVTQSRPLSPRPASPPPFLGDLNPEGILVEATMTQTMTQTRPQQPEAPEALQIGFVPPVSPRESCRSSAPGRDPVDAAEAKSVDDTTGPFFSLPREDGSRLIVHVQDAANLAALAQALATRALAEKVLPSDLEWVAMRDVYLAKIHPIIPLFDSAMLVNLPGSSGLRELIQAVVCLAASTDPETSSLLTFKTSVDGKPEPTRVSYDEYSRAVADFIKNRLEELREAQQIPLVSQIQIMALTCLYWQPAGRTERFEPLELWARLASLVHTHGIHLGILPRTRSEGDGACGEAGNRLFKCLYAIDRLIAAIAARPLMFNNMDLLQIPRPEPNDPPIFRLFLSLILLLDQVFDMYRPRPSINYIDLPVFERMAIEAGAQCEPDSLLATLEVLYHAIGVLSVRMPRHRFRTAPECDALHSLPTQHLPPSSVNARRSHSADRILDVLENYNLSPAPFVPYASTLSLSVAYRKWRFSRLPMFRARGGADFKRMLPVVQRLGAIWSSARINGQLGETVMKKLDQIETSRKKAKGTGEPATSGNTARPEAISQKSTDNSKCSLARPGATSAEAMRHIVNGSRINDRTALNPTSTRLVNATPTKATAADLQLDSPANFPPAQGYSHIDDAIPLPGDLSMIQTSSGPAGTTPQPAAVDTAALTGMVDGSVDELLAGDDALFQEWDPMFAQSVDFSFSSLLDPGNPFAWPEYGSYE